MMAFPAMIAPAAEKAGVDLPDDLEEYDPENYPHWHVFSLMQLGESMPYPGVHWNNAKIVADIPKEKLITLTFDDLVNEGFQVGTPLP